MDHTTTPVSARHADATTLNPPTDPRDLPIEFTGSGSEYFRIWIVNLLLIVVTVGLYLPFAKARRIRYFYANTLIDGQALAFHGNPWKMFRGFVLLVVLMGVYGIAGRFSPAVGLVSFIALCVVWPALWRASLQFRTANTSWRGLRMGFDGSLAGAYRAVAPLYLPLIAFIGLALYAPQPGAAGSEHGIASAETFGFAIVAAMGAVALALPWFIALTKRYQHSGLRCANQHARIDLPTWRVYGLCVKTLLMGALPTVLLIGLATGLAMVSGWRGQGSKAAPLLLTLLPLLLTYFTWFVVVGPYAVARLQNLVWSGTRSDAVVFSSRLPFRSLMWLTLKNWTLTIFTLGLYRPFAAVHTARLRLQAVALTLTGDVAQWTAYASPGMQDATGDMAGDFFGIDMGL